MKKKTMILLGVGAFTFGMLLGYFAVESNALENIVEKESLSKSIERQLIEMRVENK